MTDNVLNIADGDPVLKTDFGTEMIRQMRAVDSYGTYDITGRRRKS